MYQLTYVHGGKLRVINHPQLAALEPLYICMSLRMLPRLWNVSTKNHPQLIA